MITIEKLFESTELARVLKIKNRGKVLSTPTYFPAISGTEFDTGVLDIISFLIDNSYPRILISAYDIRKLVPSLRRRLSDEIANYLRGGGHMMIDSGVFEGYWKKDRKWTYKTYSESLLKTDCDYYFAYDILPDGLQKKPFLKLTGKYILKSSKINTKAHCIPIFHGQDPESLLAVMENFLIQNPDLGEFVSVTEEECGHSFLERAHTIRKIRAILNSLDRPTVLHILGCGNPISLATYSYCGADTFDSLGWSRLLIEPIELRIYDISQIELLKCTCEVCKKTQADSRIRAWLHNLLFYQKYIIQIQRMIRENTFRDFLLEFVGERNLKIIEKQNI